MSEEIDIEEHNILENPVVKNLFPDLSILKKEFINLSEDSYIPPNDRKVDETVDTCSSHVSKGFEYYVKVESNSKDYGDDGNDTQIVDFDDDGIDVQTVDFADDGIDAQMDYTVEVSDAQTVDYAVEVKDARTVNYEDKIANAQRVDYENEVIGVQTFDYEQPVSVVEYPYLFSSQSNDQLANLDQLENLQVKVMKLNVILKDVKPYLLRSKRFCTKCFILFADISEVNRHNLDFHTTSNKTLTATSHQITQLKIGKVRRIKSFKCRICKKMCRDGYNLALHEKVHFRMKYKNRSTSMGIEQNEKHKNDNSDVKGFIIAIESNLRKYENHVIPKPPLKNRDVKVTKWLDCDKCEIRCQNSYDFAKHTKMHSKVENRRDVIYTENHEKDKQNTLAVETTNDEDQHVFKKGEVPITEVTKKQKKTQNVLRCKVCHLVFWNRYIKENHEKSHQDKKYFDKNMRKQTQNEKPLRTTSNELGKTDTKKQNSEQMVLKSVLYKCRKCDIHFLFAKTARNHEQHMDMLINWKCPTCQRIFKIADKYLHLMQHNVINEIEVYSLSEKDLLRVLYNCPKCTLHFSEDNFLEHYFLCASKIFPSKYCYICDILVEQHSMNDHIMQHREDDSSNFTIVVTHVLNSTDAAKPNRLCELKMYYCSECKSFDTKFKKHNDSLCFNKKLFICKLCGLPILNENMPNHGKLHTIHGSIKISHFKFFDLKNGNEITPSIPSFPRCDACLVHFTSQAVVKRHICGEKAFKVCTDCNKTFSSVALRLHQPFHSISSSKPTADIQTVKTLIDLEETSLEISKQFPINNKSIVNKMCDKILVISIPKLKLPVIDKNKIESKKIFYSCNSCELAFDAYNKVVEHCQKHYENKCTVFSGQKCELCGLGFENKCALEHSSLTRMSYVTLKFDLFFFIQENSVWTKHVFKAFNDASRETILNNSIYKYEARIKLTVIQEGLSTFTFYQCDKCGCCITDNLYNHVKNSCFPLRKHLCSTCGLAFVSFLSKENHEDIHRTADIHIKDYRLVKFNTEDDKKYNENIISALNYKYILHQCRNCNGIVNVKLELHACKPNDLQTCPVCRLLLYKEDFDLHIEKHSLCNSYMPQNMKVLLCGQTIGQPQKLLKPMFTGFVCDYTFYKCAKCNACCRGFQCADHVCTDRKQKCNVCELTFMSLSHRKLHEQDADFTKDNINLVEFNKTNHKDNGKNQSIPMNNSSDCQQVSTVEIYKCPICSLHFLDKFSTFDHLRLCKPRMKISRQTCSKCGLMFTTKVLFNHLVKHHDKKRWAFNIVHVDQNNTLFKCAYCIMNFTKYCEAYDHAIQCNGSDVGEKCPNCQLTISPHCLQEHIVTHSKKYKFTTLLTVHVPSPKATFEMTLKFAGALNKRLDLAKTSLRKMNFSTCSNVLYKCIVCNVYFIDVNSMFLHYLSETHDTAEWRDNCKVCNLNFFLSDLTPHLFVHHKKWGLENNNFVVIDSSDLF